jgi:hypothetical protein
LIVTALIHVDREAAQVFGGARSGSSSRQLKAVLQAVSRVETNALSKTDDSMSMDQGDVQSSNEDYGDEEIDLDGDLWESNAQMAKLFRRIMFEPTGDLSDVTETVSAHRRAVQLTSHVWFSTFGDWFHHNPRYSRRLRLFEAMVASLFRTHHKVKLEKGIYILQAGSAHGITKGAEFTIYKDQDALVAGKSLAVMKVSEIVSKTGIVTTIQPFTTILSLPAGLADLTLAPNGHALAVQNKVGVAETFYLHVPLTKDYRPVFDAIIDELENAGSNPCQVTLVNKEQAQMEILFNPRGYTLATLDPRLVPHGVYRLPHTLGPKVDTDKMRQVLRAAARFTFNLNHTNANNPIENRIRIQFKQLLEDEDDYDDDGWPLITPTGPPNLVRGDKIDFNPEEDEIYGFDITNDTPWDLHFQCFYFDNMDLSICKRF